MSGRFLATGTKVPPRLAKTKRIWSKQRKTRLRLARKHLKVSRQRKDFAVKTARQVIANGDFVGIENLQSGLALDRDLNASKNILSKALEMCTVGHTEMYTSGEETSMLLA